MTDQEIIVSTESLFTILKDLTEVVIENPRPTLVRVFLIWLNANKVASSTDNHMLSFKIASAHSVSIFEFQEACRPEQDVINYLTRFALFYRLFGPLQPEEKAQFLGVAMYSNEHVPDMTMLHTTDHESIVCARKEEIDQSVAQTTADVEAVYDVRRYQEALCLVTTLVKGMDA